MSDVAIVYNGPSGAYHAADADGTWHELVRGAKATVPEDFAESLLEVEGHEFEFAEDVEITTEQEGEFPDDVEISTDKQGETDETFATDQDEDEDPDGVNADSSYLEE